MKTEITRKTVLTAFLATVIIAFTSCGIRGSEDLAYETYEPVYENGAQTNDPVAGNGMAAEPVDVSFEFTQFFREIPDISHTHQFDFREAYLAAVRARVSDAEWEEWDGALSWLDGSGGLMIATNTPLRDFEIFGIALTDTGEPDFDIIFNISDIYYRLDEFLPGTPLFMHYFFITGGVFPSRGIAFTDSAGIRHTLAMQDDRRGDEGDPPYHLLEFVDGEVFQW